MHRHHLEVESRWEEWTPFVWEDEFVQQELRRSLFHGSSNVREDLQTHIVGPVVEYEVEKVYSSPWGSISPDVIAYLIYLSSPLIG